MTRGEDLLSLIRRRIHRRGRIPFRDFMAAALYEPGLGRYRAATPPMGPSGDYITSPEVDGAFGRLLGRAVADMHRRTIHGGGEGPFTVVEAGPGRGTLCRDLLAGLSREEPGLHDDIRYLLVEASPELIRQQERLLAGEPACHGKVAWSSWEVLSRGEALRGCILANEFLDALPVHLVEMRGGRLREVHVVEGEGGELAQEPGPLSRPELARHFSRAGIELEEGQRAEVNLEALRWIREAAGVLERGYVVIIDYGHEAGELYSRRHFDGTLLGYRKHQAVTDLLACPGGQDLTSHVDFTALERAAREAGFTRHAMTSQRNVLVNLGLAEMIAGLAGPPGGEGEAERLRKRFSLHALMSPGGMGSVFKVMVLGKGAGLPMVPWMRDPFRGPVEGTETGMYTPLNSRKERASAAAGTPRRNTSRIERTPMPSDSASLSGQALRSALRESAGPAEGIAAVVAKIHESNPLYTWTGVYLMEGTELVLAHEIGKPTPHRRIPLDKGICGAAAREGSTIIVDDVNADPRYLACSLETRSEIVVPIRSGDGRILGEIDIDSDTPAAFDHGDRQALEGAAAVLSEFLQKISGGDAPGGKVPEARPRKRSPGGAEEPA